MMRYAEGVWETLDCPPNLGTGLVWRQDLCSCGEELVAQDPNDWCAQRGFNKHPANPHKYNRVGLTITLQAESNAWFPVLLLTYALHTKSNAWFPVILLTYALQTESKLGSM